AAISLASRMVSRCAPPPLSARMKNAIFSGAFDCASRSSTIVRRLFGNAISLEHPPRQRMQCRVLPYKMLRSVIGKQRQAAPRQRVGEIELRLAARAEAPLVGILANRKVEYAEAFRMEHLHRLHDDKPPRRATGPASVLRRNPHHHVGAAAREAE